MDRMSKDWKHGDVAMVECSDGEWRPAFYLPATLSGYPNWRFADGMLRDAGLSRARPLVVIDPEDREQVERLAERIGHLWRSENYVADVVQAALREFANPTPPKPEEPTGLGAVVEDSDGDLWTSVTNKGASDRWQPNNLRSDSERREWDDLAAVRVLSEGIQP